MLLILFFIFRYPWVCKTGKFPTGHPEIVRKDFKDLATKPYEGLIKCRVNPPRKLLLPFLGYKSGGKLTFTLCRTCQAEHLDVACQHGPAERALTGTWTSDEIYLAMELGYEVSNLKCFLKIFINIIIIAGAESVRSLPLRDFFPVRRPQS